MGNQAASSSRFEFYFERSLASRSKPREFSLPSTFAPLVKSLGFHMKENVLVRRQWDFAFMYRGVELKRNLGCYLLSRYSELYAEPQHL
jgi:hypothetical protein